MEVADGGYSAVPSKLVYDILVVHVSSCSGLKRSVLVNRCISFSWWWLMASVVSEGGWQ